MKYRRNTFLIIAISYLAAKLITFLSQGSAENSVVVPGWHTTIEYHLSYNSWFTPVFFLAVALVYNLARNFPSRICFTLHTLVSIVPLISLIVWPLIFTGSRFNFDGITVEFRAMRILEWFFTISQAVFLGILLIKSNLLTPAEKT